MLAPRAAHATCNARTRFLSLPSHLRLLSHQQSSRSFSASPSRRIEPTDLFTATPTAILQSLHVVGIPWYAAIPLAAVLVRGVFGYYFAAVPARRRQQIRNNLHPLISARMRLEMLKDPTGAGTSLAKFIPNPVLRKSVYPNWLAWYVSHDCGRHFRAGMIAATSFVNIAALLATAESVRMLCGAREGLLKTILSPFTALARFLAPDYFPPVVSRVDVAAEAYANKMEQVRQARLQPLEENGVDKGIDLEALSGNVLPTPQPLSQLANTYLPQFDPSLQTEGLSWCVDLTAADPYAALPILTCAVMVGRILVNPQPIRPSSLPSGTLLRPLRFLTQRYSFGQKCTAALALILAYFLQNMPAAVVLYIFSSIVTGLVQKKWVDFAMPMRSAIQPCKRRTRVRTRKDFGVRQ
jgi:inner membrane protein COX18